MIVRRLRLRRGLGRVNEGGEEMFGFGDWRDRVRCLARRFGCSFLRGGSGR